MFALCSLLAFLLHLIQISCSCSLSSPPILPPRVQPSHIEAFFSLALHTKYKNVKPAVLGMLPKETVLFKIFFFRQNIFKVSGEESNHSGSQLYFLLLFPQVLPAQH